MPRTRKALLIAVLASLTVATPAHAHSVKVDILAQNAGWEILAVDGLGLTYGKARSGTGRLYTLYRSADKGSTWTKVGAFPSNSEMRYLTPLKSGTLLMHLNQSSAQIWRSADRGATWTRVFTFPHLYRTLTAHSIGDDASGNVFMATYNTLDSANHPNWVYRSRDDGRTWSVVYRRDTSRHAHLLQVDPYSGCAYVGFGDSAKQSALVRSCDGGLTWRNFLTGSESTAVDVTFDVGHLVFGQDKIWSTPYIVRVDKATATVQRMLKLPQPSYSALRLSSGIFLIGTTHEPVGSAIDKNDPNVHLYASADGITWNDAFAVPWVHKNGYIRLQAQFKYPDDTFPIQVVGQGFRIGRATVLP